MRARDERARGRLRGRDAVVRARCAPREGAEVGIQWEHDDGLIFVGSFSAAFLRRAWARCGASCDRPARAIVRLVMRGVRGEGGGVTVDAAFMEDLEAARDGRARDDDAFDRERCYLILGMEVDGRRVHVPLPLTRVRFGDEGGGGGGGGAAATASGGGGRVEALEEEMRRMRLRHEAEIAALKSKHEAAMAAMRASETRLRVKLRDAVATAKAVERTRGAREERARRRDEGESDERSFWAVVAKSDDADREMVERQDEAMEAIDARLRSLQDFLSRTRDESRPPPTKHSNARAPSKTIEN